MGKYGTRNKDTANREHQGLYVLCVYIYVYIFFSFITKTPVRDTGSYTWPNAAVAGILCRTIKPNTLALWNNIQE